MGKDFDKQALMEKLKRSLSISERADDLQRDVDEMENHAKYVNEDLKAEVDALKKRTEDAAFALENVRMQIHDKSKTPTCPGSNFGVYNALGVAFTLVGIFLAIVLGVNESDAWSIGIVLLFLGILFLILGGTGKTKYKNEYSEYIQKEQEYSQKIKKLSASEKEWLERSRQLNSAYESKLAEYKEKIADLDIKLSSLDSKREEVEHLRREAISAIPDIIPQKFKTLHFMSSLVDYLNNDLVDNMREAIMLYNNEQYQEKTLSTLQSLRFSIYLLSNSMDRNMRESASAQNSLRRELQEMNAERERLQRESNYLMRQNLEMQEQMHQEAEQSRKEIERLRTDAEEFHKKFED